MLHGQGLQVVHHDSPHLQVVGQCEEEGEDDPGQGETEGGPHPGVPDLLEGADHREVSLHGQGYCQVHTGRQTGLQ